MFADFKKAFKKDESNTKLPEAVVAALSESLPPGFKYAQIDKESMGIVPTTDQLKINIKLKMPLNFTPSTTEELMEFLYRTQQELESPSKYIELNGHKFTANEFIKFPFKDTKLSEEFTKLIIKPEPFPDPFPIELELIDEHEPIKKVIYIQRQPYPHMSKSLFKSIDKGALEVSYIIDEKKMDLSLTINININRAKNVIDIVEASKLYKGFIQGKIKFSGAVLNAVPERKEDDSLFEQIIFWEKVDMVARKLNVEFKPQENMTQEDVFWIEKLYLSFVVEKPYKEYIKVNKFTTKTNQSIDTRSFIDSNGISFQFTQNEEIELLGVKLSLFSLVAWFDLRVSNINLLDEKSFNYEFVIEPTTDKGIYQSIRHFKNQNEAIEYRNKFTEVSEEMQNADMLNID